MNVQQEHGIGAPQIVALDQKFYVMRREQVPVASIAEFYDRAYPELFGFVAQQGLQMIGAPIGVSFSAPTATIDLGAALPVATLIESTGSFQPFVISAGRAAKVRVVGNYDQLPQAYQKLEAWATEQGLHKVGAPWEEYLSDPSQVTSEEDHVTDVYWPLAD